MAKRNIIIRHVAVWLIYIGYEVAYLHFSVGRLASFSHFAIYYLLNIALFYFNAYVILDFAFFRTKSPYQVAVILVSAEIIAYLLIKMALDYFLDSSRNSFFDRLLKSEPYLMANLWRGVYFIGLSIAFWSTRYMIHFKDKNHVMETEQLKGIAEKLELENKYMSVENAYLQNQISPHLLFNSLNFIYNTVYVQSASAGNGVMRLAELMRYSLVSADDTRTVLLREEVGQLENLVALCRMRFGGTFFLRFTKRGRRAGIRIIPLILITLAENMMKHGDLGDKNHPAHIVLHTDGKTLFFETRNKKRNTSLYPKRGLGLENIKKRLNNFYEDRYDLKITDLTEFFTITLTIEL